MLSGAGAGLAGCSAVTGSLLPDFGAFGGGRDASPDCAEIEQRMTSAKLRYASVLGGERPAIYLGFTGNLSKSMTAHRLNGLHELTELQIDEVVDDTANSCRSSRLPREVCEGAARLGEAYRPLVTAARDAYHNYCGERPIR